MKDLRQSSDYASFMSKRGWIVERIPTLNKSQGRRKIFTYIRKLPLPPVAVMKIQRFKNVPDFEEVKKLVKKHRIISVSLEPDVINEISTVKLDQIMNGYGFRRSKEPFLPTKTVRIDLKKIKQQIISDMKKDARYSIRKVKEKVITETLRLNDPDRIDEFYKFWRNYGKGYILTRHEFDKLLSAFKEKVLVVTAYQKSKLLAGCVILISDLQAYYAYAVTSPVGRKLFAGYLVVWKAILEAKKKRCKIFDFEGIYDERYPVLKRWKGFSDFKKKFGGEEISYPGVYTKYTFPF